MNFTPYEYFPSQSRLFEGSCHGTHHIFILDCDDEVQDLVEFVEGDFPEHIVLDEPK